ncbi:glycosyltransferase [bacterium]|nr:glycosyltransferase [bacterium]
MPKVSVIIPVYNTEKYITQCLDSIINQTLNDIEIICINDNSTDNSLGILKEYSSKDKRIKIINLKKNSGVSKVRNEGIKVATGEYIAFVDSDDFIDLDFYEKLYNIAKESNSDCAKGNIFNYSEETRLFELSDFYNINDKIRDNKAFFYYGFTSAIYKKQFIDRLNLRFPEGANYFEDVYFSILASVNYNKVEIVDSAKYYYRKRKNSLSDNFFELSKIKDYTLVSKKIISYLFNKNLSEKEYMIILDFIFTFAKNYLNEEKAEDEIYGFLLDTYNQYNYLNNKKNLIKILVSYIKPSFLFKSDIFTPIHLGRTVEREISKDGEVIDSDIEWLHKNCIGDNDFEGNISHLNRRLGFFTGTFWAWKNYEKLGNPEYFGSFGYRRLFYPYALNNLENYDLILPLKTQFGETLKEQMTGHHSKKLFDVMIDALEKVYPNELENASKYFDMTEGYYWEIYIMKRNLFFDFCEWINKLINYLFSSHPDFIKKEIKISRTSILFSDFTGNERFLKNELYKKYNEARDIAFIIERLSGFYFWKLTNSKDIKYKECAIFQPDMSEVKQPEYKKLIIDQMRKNVVKSLKKESCL